MPSQADLDQIRKDLDTSQIKDWRSIITLVVFIITNLIVLIPFKVPVFLPRVLVNAFTRTLVGLRIIPPRRNGSSESGAFVRFAFPLNFITAPLIADLFLLAILAIGRREVHDGIIGANNIAPYDIMLFFCSLAYIAISIDTSGLIRYMAYKVLIWGGEAGHRLYFYLYAFFFLLTAGIGNDPVILSGSPFLAYMTRVSANISHPRAWIFSQFAVANIASTILVSSNPTNLVIAGAFGIRFVNYSANVIVPVLVTGVVLFPCLLYIIFRNESLVPKQIEMHQLSEEARAKKPVNPNIPIAKTRESTEEDDSTEKRLPLEEIMNPYIDKVGAWFAAGILAITLVTLLIVNAVLQGKRELHAFWVTLPAAVITLCFDLVWGWMNRHETRRIAQGGAQEDQVMSRDAESGPAAAANNEGDKIESGDAANTTATNVDEKHTEQQARPQPSYQRQEEDEPATLSSIVSRGWRWFHVTFPTAATVLAHLPLALVLFAFCMFILVQALVTKGWVPVFAHGWNAWVKKTGTVGAIGGMGFIGVILCNCAGTNIGTSILLARIIQAWQEISVVEGTTISDRTFWATIYSLAIALNYGAFSISFSASLAGMLWRDILGQKTIHVRSIHFIRYNLPIITITMIVGMSVLVGQVYIVRGTEPYNK